MSETATSSRAPISVDGRVEPESRKSSLLPDWRAFDQAPILNYQWPGHWPEGAVPEHRDAIYGDARAMGFNGTYKIDWDAPHGADRFLRDGGFGLMRQARFREDGPPVISHDGTPAQFQSRRYLPDFKSIFAEQNAIGFYEGELAYACEYGLERLFHVGDTLVLSSWDETGAYTRKQMEYGYSAREEYIAFLRDVVFHAASPADDGNGDGWTYNRLAGTQFVAWEEVPMPALADRFRQPGVWKYWIDFHGYYTSLFFRRGGDYMARALGHPVELFTFFHAWVKWPGISSVIGLDLYWEAKLNRVLTVEESQWEHPGVTVHYAITNQLSRRYGRPVMGWSWFSQQPQRCRDPLEIERALARVMGHDSHGLIVWLYGHYWGAKAEARAALATWHHIYQAHWEFLRDASVPAPKVAVLSARNTGNMYGRHLFSKADFGWSCQALSELQVPFEVILDNQVEMEPEVLADYRVLIIPTATWESPLLRERVAAFIARGGHVMVTGDSFLMDTAGGETAEFLEAQFGVRPGAIHKSAHMPSYSSLEEEAWVLEHAARYQNPTWSGHPESSDYRTRQETATPVAFGDADLATLRDALPATGCNGLPQSLLDPRVPQLVTAESGADWASAQYRTFHDIVTAAAAPRATVVARFGADPCAVETARTLWVGFRPGHDHACLFPIYDMRSFGEPIWPFATNPAGSAAEREAPTRWFARIVAKAGIERPLTVTRDNDAAPHIEILTRVATNGDRMVFLINHDRELGGTHTLGGPALRSAAVVADIRAGQRLAVAADGTVRVAIAPGTAMILGAGSEAFVAGRIEAQQRVPRSIPPMPDCLRADAP